MNAYDFTNPLDFIPSSFVIWFQLVKFYISILALSIGSSFFLKLCCCGGRPDFAAIPTIYKPLSAAGFDWSRYVEKIEQIRKNINFMGIALAKDEKGEPYPVYILKEKGQDKCAFIAKGLRTGDLLGHIVVKPMAGIYIDTLQNFTQKFSNLSDEGPLAKRVQNIGVILIKMVLQVAPPGFRIRLYASENTGPYYYKLGFRVEQAFQSGLNEAFARIVKNREIGDDFGGVDMYLPEEGRRLWAQEILQNPIGLPGN